MSIEASGGAISNGEYLAWMAEHTGALYDEMRGAMDFADRRADIAEGLADVKARLGDIPTGAQLEKPEQQWTELADHLRKLLASAEGSPEAGELTALLQPMLDEIQIERRSVEAGAEVTWWEAPSEEQVTRWSDQLQARIDRLHKDDQMALITIQDLNAQVQQATQLASSLIASANQAMHAVLANIKG